MASAEWERSGAHRHTQARRIVRRRLGLRRGARLHVGRGNATFSPRVWAVPARGNRGACKKIMGLSIFLLQLRRGGATIMVLIVPSGRGAQRFRNPPKG